MASKKLHSSSSNQRRKGNAAAAATSPASMGKALVLLATSCAALSSGGNQIANCRTASQSTAVQRHCGRVRTHSNPAHPTTALYYRDGDEDQSPQMRAANQSAVDSAISGSKASGGNVAATPTRQVSITSQFTLFSPIIRLMPHMPHMPQYTSQPVSEEDKDQLVMDEYLEYVERRYSRMHPKNHRAHRARQQQQHGRRPKVVLDFHLPRKIFLSTLALQRVESPGQSTPASSDQQSVQTRENHSVASAYGRAATAAARNQRQQQDEDEDPLNVLGLTSLASERLRQRLHVPRDLRDEHMLLTSGTTSAVNFIQHMVHLNDHPVPTSGAPSSSSAQQSNEVATSGGRTSSYTSLSFTAQFSLLLSTLQRLAVAFVNTMRLLTAFGSRVFSEVLDRGGFRHSVRMVGVASVAIVLMFRPLFRNMMRQG